MKKSITENKKYTVEQLIKLFIYRPYCDEIQFMVAEDERIHIKGDTWIVILDHNTGEFYFEGKINRYYEIDTITSIRDCFGDIYSVFNFKYGSIPRDTWISIKDEVETAGKTSYQIQFEDEEKKRKMLEYKRDYYWAHKEEINKRQKEYYKRKNQIT